ncbi:MAG TPA: peptidylprolyl isomerase [Herpetosiphonaceae bacterium]
MAIKKPSRTRQIVIEVGIALLLVIVARVAWDQLYVATRPVAQVGDETISRRQYRELVELDLAQQFAYLHSELGRYDELMSGAGDTTALFEQDRQRTIQLRDAVVEELRQVQGSRLDSALVDHWIGQELVLQGAAHEGIAVDEHEVNATLIKTLAAPPGEDGHGHDADEAAGTNAGPAATDTPAPESAQALLSNAYSELVRVLKAEHTIAVGFSEAAFASHIRRQQRVELLKDQIETRLVPDSEAPRSLQAHAYFLLLPVTSPITGTDTITATPDLNDPAFDAAKVEVDELYQQLKQGADFLKLAQEHSANPDETVDPGWSVPDTLWPPLKEAVLNQPLGEAGQPVKTPSGWYIVKVLERAERPDTAKLEQMRAERLQQWTERQRAALAVRRF